MVNATTSGDWIQTSSGKMFYPLAPRVEDVDLADIAHALSQLCRFGGHSREFISVAQHSVNVSRHCPEFPREALLHDATEAYLVDVPRPIKYHLGGYKEAEHKLAIIIGERFGLVLNPLPERVHEEDERALATEKACFHFPAPARWVHMSRKRRWPEDIVSWTPQRAESEFLKRAKELGIK